MAPLIQRVLVCPVDAICTLGSRPMCEPPCARCCSSTSTRRDNWAGARLCWTARLFRPKKGAATSPNPTERGKSGTERHLVVDRRDAPLRVALSGANRPKNMMMAPTLNAITGVHRRGCNRLRRRPERLYADKGYDHCSCQAECRACGIEPRIARRGVESSQRLGRHRWVVKRTHAWLASSGVWLSVISDAKTSTSPSSSLAAPLSTSTRSNDSVRRSKAPP